MPGRLAKVSRTRELSGASTLKLAARWVTGWVTGHPIGQRDQAVDRRHRHPPLAHHRQVAERQFAQRPVDHRPQATLIMSATSGVGNDRPDKGQQRATKAGLPQLAQGGVAGERPHRGGLGYRPAKQRFERRNTRVPVVGSRVSVWIEGGVGLGGRPRRRDLEWLRALPEPASKLRC